METIHLLAVSREAAMLRLLWSMAEANAWHLETAASGLEAMERVQSGAMPELLLLGLPHGDAESLHILRWLRRIRPELPVIALGSSDDALGAQEAMNLGAREVLPGPFSEQQIEFAIERQLGLSGNGQSETSGEHFEQLGPDGMFVSSSPIMQKVRGHVELLAQADVPVLILGEAGSGKYAVASLIHKLSVRSGFKLLRVNCAEMPESVLEVELFGQEPEAGLGFSRTSLGRFAPGEKGAIYLEEVAEMPAALQARLVQVLQNQGAQNQGPQNQGAQNHDAPKNGGNGHALPAEFRRTAIAEAAPADVRIFAASSTNLSRAVASKQLREDLYYSLSVFTVHVPPLRQRKDEIATLLRYLMHKLAKHYSLPPRTLSAEVLEACQRYSWPGNLKELETFAKRYLLAGDPELSLGENRFGLGDNGRQASIAVTVATAPWDAKELGQDELGRSESVRPQSQPESLKSLIQGIKSEAEQNAIGAALRRTGWNRKAAARLLRVSYRTLLYKIEQYHMRAPDSYLAPLPEDELSVPGNGVKGDGKAS
ncbi:MAG: sigma-54 dependent transcriptional regulator [Candidatus Sulfotelmatobacter sp.]|jgi:DNA-binding NtrC family response regulator